MALPSDLSGVQACSWDDLLESMLSAKNEYEVKMSKGKTFSSPKSRIVIATLHSLTDMIPDQNGLSVMRGGLRYIFEVIPPDQANICINFEDTY